MPIKFTDLKEGGIKKLRGEISPLSY